MLRGPSSVSGQSARPPKPKGDGGAGSTLSERRRMIAKDNTSWCEMCWKRVGEAWNGLRICYGCKSDLNRGLNFLAAKGWQIQTPLTSPVEGIEGSIDPGTGVEALKKRR